MINEPNRGNATRRRHRRRRRRTSVWPARGRNYIIITIQLRIVILCYIYIYIGVSVCVIWLAIGSIFTREPFWGGSRVGVRWVGRMARLQSVRSVLYNNTNRPKSAHLPSLECSFPRRRLFSGKDPDGIRHECVFAGGEMLIRLWHFKRQTQRRHAWWFDCIHFETRLLNKSVYATRMLRTELEFSRISAVYIGTLD